MQKRKTLSLISLALVVLLVVTFLGVNFISKKQASSTAFYFGVDVGYGDENDIYKTVDAIKGFANLIIIGSTIVTENTTKLTNVCNYLYQNDFSFIIYVGFGPVVPKGPEKQFFNTTVKQWGNKFLGAYVFDEAGGKQLDYSPGTPHYVDRPVKQANNFTDASIQYIHVLFNAITDFTGPKYYDAPDLKVYTSDYALYWFDYLVGYNIVFGEFVGNQSRQLSIALCRGAANVHNMNWGTMITWKYNQPPFLEEPEQLYDDMVLAYKNNAKHIVIFNSPENQTAPSEIGTLTPQHIDAMKRFWTFTTTNPQPEKDPAEVAYVLPRDYGFGFRRQDDTIWGLWQADKLTSKIWNDANNLVTQYNEKIDIVYETLTSDFPARLMYKKLVFWNGTVIGTP